MVGDQCNSYGIPWQSGMCNFGGGCGWACFWPIQDIFVAAEPLCDVGTSSWALITLLRVIYRSLSSIISFFAQIKKIVLKQIPKNCQIWLKSTKLGPKSRLLSQNQNLLSFKNTNLAESLFLSGHIQFKVRYRATIMNSHVVCNDVPWHHRNFSST